MNKKKLEKEEFKYSKKQLVTSKKYSKERDILNSILSENERYSFIEVDKLIDEFMKGKVN